MNSPCYLMCGIESVEDVIRVIFQPPGLPDLEDTDHPLGTLPEPLSIQGDHAGPVTGVGTAGDAARQLVEEDRVGSVNVKNHFDQWKTKLSQKSPKS